MLNSKGDESSMDTNADSQITVDLFSKFCAVLFFTLRCSYCGKSFNRKAKLSYHIHAKHKSATSGSDPNKSAKLKCDSCEKTFKSKTLLEKHVRLRHTQEGIDLLSSLKSGEVLTSNIFCFSFVILFGGPIPFIVICCQQKCIFKQYCLNFFCRTITENNSMITPFTPKYLF